VTFATTKSTSSILLYQNFLPPNRKSFSTFTENCDLKTEPSIYLTKQHHSLSHFFSSSPSLQQELEIRLETQKQTLIARDESIKKLLEMLQNKGMGE
jgi:hypothetical protein